MEMAPAAWKLSMFIKYGRAMGLVYCLQMDEEVGLLNKAE